MPIGAIIGGVTSIGGALIGSKAAKKGANAQVQAAQLAVDENKRQYDLTRSDFAPWREAGGEAIGQLSDMIKPGYDYTASPGYQWRFGEGQRAVEGSAASKGMLMSGGTLKDLTRFGQGLAADDYNQQFNRVASVSAGGQQANNAVANAGQIASGRISDLLTQQGNARASGYAASGQAWQGALKDIAGLFQ